MAEQFNLGAPEQQNYGYLLQGYVVGDGETDIPVTIYSPHQGLDQLKDLSEHPTTLVLATGLGGARNSMQTAAIAAVAAHKTAVTFNYTNTRHRGALDANAETMARVFEALPDGTAHEALGFSMGGAVLALTMAKAHMSRATFVSPAGFIPALDEQPWSEIAKHFGEQSIREVAHEREVAAQTLVSLLSGGRVFPQAREQWDTIWRCAGSSLTDMLGRHAAVLSELSELTSGRTVCEEFRTAMAKKDAPSAHLYYASGDALVPSRELSAATTGLPFTTRNVYDGGQAGHTRFIYDPTLPAKIFADESTSPHDIAA